MSNLLNDVTQILNIAHAVYNEELAEIKPHGGEVLMTSASFEDAGWLNATFLIFFLPEAHEIAAFSKAVGSRLDSFGPYGNRLAYTDLHEGEDCLKITFTYRMGA